MRVITLLLAVVAIMIVTVHCLGVQTTMASDASPGAAEGRAAAFPEPISTALVIGVTVAMLLWKIVRKSGWV